MHAKKVLCLLTLAGLLFSCSSARLTEEQRFLKSIMSELPFEVDTLRSLGPSTFGFHSPRYVDTPPDYTIGANGALTVYRTTFIEAPVEHQRGQLWRNVVVSKRSHRVICVDRIRNQTDTDGRLYVMQMETADYPTLTDVFHWDVSDERNVQAVGNVLDDYLQASLRWMRGDEQTDACPKSQDAYWRLMFHADSLYDAQRYDEATEVYDAAFCVDKYILPSQLSTVARKMAAVGRSADAERYQRHRLHMEPDTFHYNLPLKNALEAIFESDQYDRLLWLYASQDNPADTVRTAQLAERALRTDSMNLAAVISIVNEHGFPDAKEVGPMAVQAVWLVFQHSDLAHQRQFLPAMERAVADGKIEAAFLATLKDRIDVREGRPQRYGTQLGPDGKPCELLDAARVNEWRAEVGLPPLDAQ